MTLVLFIAAFGWLAGAQVNDTYEKFVVLDYKNLKHGTSPEDGRAMRRLRDEFLKTPEPSALFLIEKVQDLNQEEARFTGKNSSQDELSYDSYLSEQGRSSLLKGSLVLLLADLYHQVGPETKTKILTVFSEFLTPSERYFHSNPLDWALARIGKDSVAVLLKLADHDDASVRCHFADALTGLKAFTGLSAPKIDCRAQDVIRQQQIVAYTKWWASASKKATWPVVPSIFDEVASREDGTVKRRSKNK